MTTKLILDTDIGGDIDDAICLAYLLMQPECDLLGITTVTGEPEKRAALASVLCEAAGKDIPIYPGLDQPILGEQRQRVAEQAVALPRWPHRSLFPRGEAVEFLRRTIRAHPGEITLLTIGPLTNIAQAFLLEPLLAQNLAHLTLMGGVVRNLDRLDLPYCEYNIRCDPEAAQIVFSAGAPLTVVPLDVTTLVRMLPAGVERIKKAGTPYHQAVAGQVELYPPFKERGFTYTHDPLAVATLIWPDLVKLRDLHVDVETGGSFTSGATLVRTPVVEAPANAQFALEVDTLRFEEFLVARLAS